MMMNIENGYLLDFSKLYKSFCYAYPYGRAGKIISSRGEGFEVGISRAQIGMNVEFVSTSGERCDGEVIAILRNRCIAIPYREMEGINSETLVYLKDSFQRLKLSKNLVGRVIDYEGNPIDDKGPIGGPFESRSIFGDPINPLDRSPIEEPLDVGVDAINSFLTIGKGQRISIMAGSGVGKSFLLGMIARHTSADINIIALIGERGREVLEFIKSDLGEDGLKKSVIIVATSDASPLIKIKAAYVATTIAEYFRDQNKQVVYMMDSITRFAMACREISLAAGETPGLKGYPPSVFSKLPKILERAGTKRGSGSITGFYSVLIEGGDMDEPVADMMRGSTDGHIILSRELVMRNHYPAIDILRSISRVAKNVISDEHQIVAGHLRDLLGVYTQNEDLINIGAYVRGSNAKLDKSISIHGDIIDLLKQGLEYRGGIDNVYDRMVKIARKGEEGLDGEVGDAG